MSKATEETWYIWKVPKEVDGRTRLLTPRSNPREHEQEWNLISSTIDEAYWALEEWGAVEDAIAEGWILCKEVLTPLAEQRVLTPTEDY